MQLQQIGNSFFFFFFSSRVHVEDIDGARTGSACPECRGGRGCNFAIFASAWRLATAASADVITAGIDNARTGCATGNHREFAYRGYDFVIRGCANRASGSSCVSNPPAGFPTSSVFYVTAGASRFSIASLLNRQSNYATYLLVYTQGNLVVRMLLELTRYLVKWHQVVVNQRSC